MVAILSHRNNLRRCFSGSEVNRGYSRLATATNASDPSSTSQLDNEIGRSLAHCTDTARDSVLKKIASHCTVTQKKAANTRNKEAKRRLEAVNRPVSIIDPQ